MGTYIKTATEINLGMTTINNDNKWVALNWLENELNRLDRLIQEYGCPHIQVQKLREKLRENHSK